ncbi:SDR family oxidoreductase [Phytohabitans flavus]|uniref:Gluconate 5-dehydrogenase n=1 Tax=Phytohabitans flavus TaxID=1076124 RepID=A0A6F8Y572_9ACTN|nr:SDR family oxidoreductase [Phytohabitans flavus]BCB81262.1 gluconate 5-dehydrogenase [Phytohabitans flavus]
MSTYLESLFSLAGRVALVTGGSSGIGRAIAEALGRAGANVVLVARREAPLAAAVAELGTVGVEAAAVAADLSDRAALREAAEAAVKWYGEPDILVNSAAINRRPHLSELTEDDWDATITANLDAPFLLGQRFGPAMAERGWGRIINIASQQSVRAYGNSGAYGAAKAGLAGLTRSQAEAWSRHGVTSNAIAPGIVRTPLTAELFADPARVATAAGRTMVGRNGELDDFAGVAVFVASESSAYVTGQMLFVDGGFSVA